MNRFAANNPEVTDQTEYFADRADYARDKAKNEPSCRLHNRGIPTPVSECDECIKQGAEIRSHMRELGMDR